MVPPGTIAPPAVAVELTSSREQTLNVFAPTELRSGCHDRRGAGRHANARNGFTARQCQRDSGHGAITGVNLSEDIGQCRPYNARSKLTASSSRLTMALSRMRSALRPLVVLSLVIAMTGAALAECVAENLTPEQKACCAAMGHDCGKAGAEMGCCPTEPQTQDRAQATGVRPDLIRPAVVSGPLALLPEPYERLRAVAASSFSRETLKLPDRPAYLLLSVFLI
jgi:hypothetical protein